MGLLDFFRQILLWLKYRRAETVHTPAELEAALRRMPPRIVVEGNEALRAHAAKFAHRGGDPDLPEDDPPIPGAPPSYMIVPTVGRIRDGLRTPRRPERKARKLHLKSGLETILVAVTGIAALLLIEWLLTPEQTPQLILGPHAAHHAAAPQATPHWLVWVAVLLLGLVAAVSLAFLVWQAAGLGRPIHTGWRLEYRVQGRLIMARVRKRRP